jgi:hypothetical protein
MFGYLMMFQLQSYMVLNEIKKNSFSLHHCNQTSSGAHLAFFQMSLFSGGKVARA